MGWGTRSAPINKYQGRGDGMDNCVRIRSPASSVSPLPSQQELCSLISLCSWGSPWTLVEERGLKFPVRKKNPECTIMADEVPNYSIRGMRRDEIPAVLDLWRDTGLSEGTHSLDTWYSHDPEGFFVAVTDDDTVIGACAGVLQNEDLAFVGLYVVKNSYRRQGIGMKIWNAVMERIGDRNVGVNPVPEQLENYRDKSGFPVQTCWNSKVSVASTIDTSLLSYDVPDVNVQMLSTSDADVVEQVVQYDADVCGFTRGDLVPLLCEQGDSVTMVATKDGLVCGYGNIKKNIKGNTIIGPLYADNGDIAEKILHELVKAFPIAEEEGALIFTVDCNKSAMGIIDKLGFETDCVISRLYRKEEVDVKFDKIFAQYNLNFSIF